MEIRGSAVRIVVMGLGFKVLDLEAPQGTDLGVSPRISNIGDGSRALWGNLLGFPRYCP